MQYKKIERTAKFRSRCVKTAIYTGLVIWALLVLFPFYWMILTSLKGYSAYNSEYVPQLYTLAPTLENYVQAFTAVPLAKSNRAVHGGLMTTRLV